ncbi:MAG: MBL fold metallo-hydrolase [Myxococcales bacterium]|nr:MBL fold metallo-hydrolase [Myxococcales bacterium]
MHVQHFFDDLTGTLTYVVHDGRRGIVIDPIRDYEPKSARTSWRSAERVAAWLRERGIAIDWVVDTHAHADHMSGLPYFKEHFGARTVTGAGVGVVQATFRDVYGLERDFPVDGSQFDRLVEDGERLAAGDLDVEVMHTPGHTPAHVALRVGDAVFVGDTLFMPDYGSARCDFPGGSAGVLWDSIQRLYALPDATRVFTGHDYRPNGRPLAFVATVGEHARANVQIRRDTSRDAYVAFREERDATLEAPLLILPSVQVNIRAGELPPPDANGIAYLRIPLDTLGRSRKR